ncbi:MAG TPA: toll/interleukin-1 receptor domain-containing protein [Sphingomicrobium sp.]|jgi:adenylate cyclase|nr:toll/interleukin-1 receptor domain-containing protein [Sphingomicrobium sp.]
MVDVFISYARENRTVAARVADELRASGLSVWLDDDLAAHRAYSEVIEQRLQEASAVVVLWSKASAGSQWVRAEADFGRNAGKLVQARLDSTMPPLPFNQIECADLKRWRGKREHRGWGKLVASVAALVNGGFPETPRPKPNRRSPLLVGALAIGVIALFAAPLHLCSRAV